MKAPSTKAHPAGPQIHLSYTFYRLKPHTFHWLIPHTFHRLILHTFHWLIPHTFYRLKPNTFYWLKPHTFHRLKAHTFHRLILHTFHRLKPHTFHRLQTSWNNFLVCPTPSNYCLLQQTTPIMQPPHDIAHLWRCYACFGNKGWFAGHSFDFHLPKWSQTLCNQTASATSYLKSIQWWYISQT